jgi:hypothetical protein
MTNSDPILIILQLAYLIAFLNFQAHAFRLYKIKKVHRGVAFVADWVGLTCFGISLLSMQMYIALIPFSLIYAIHLDDRIYKLRAWLWQRRHPDVRTNS